MKRGKLAVWILAASVLGPSLAANAEFVVDLRFLDGSKEMVLSGAKENSDVYIQVWGQVTGTDPLLRDGLNFVYGAAKSLQVSGGVVIGGAGVGITGIDLHPAFKKVGAYQSGAGANTSADGIQDWGNAAVHTSAVKFSSNETVVYPDSTNPPPISNPIENGTEYLLGTLRFHVGEIQWEANPLTACTQVNWVKPTWTLPTAVAYYNAVPDEKSDQDPRGARYYVGAPVTFYIPEPAAMGLVLLGWAALLARPRRSR